MNWILWDICLKKSSWKVECIFEGGAENSCEGLCNHFSIFIQSLHIPICISQDQKENDVTSKENDKVDTLNAL